MTLPELLDLYKKVLAKSEPVSAYTHNPEGHIHVPGASIWQSSREHARWMLDNMPAEIEKVNRWLGFVQCVLWMTGEYTLTQLQEHIRNLNAV